MELRSNAEVTVDHISKYSGQQYTMVLEKNYFLFHVRLPFDNQVFFFARFLEIQKSVVITKQIDLPFLIFPVMGKIFWIEAFIN